MTLFPAVYNSLTYDMALYEEGEKLVSSLFYHEIAAAYPAENTVVEFEYTFLFISLQNPYIFFTSFSNIF